MINKKQNQHLVHLIGKSMPELRKMFPDAKFCDSPTCEFEDIDHAIYMEYEQKIKDAERKGMIRIMYRMNKEDDNFISTKLFHWFNGKKWIELSNTDKERGNEP